MDSLKKAVIEKCGHNFGFEYTVSESPNDIVLGSANHPLQVIVSLGDLSLLVKFANASSLLLCELKRNFDPVENGFQCSGESELADLLRRSSALASSLPNQAEQVFEANLAIALKKLPESVKNTEVETLVRQRVGQQAFRNAMLAYWGNACAVTGINLPDVLRASHAKPWSVCENDTERLDVFNGVLLTANLDALFDRFMISFDVNGVIMISEAIDYSTRRQLGLMDTMTLRWIADEHQSYLQYHREQFRSI